MQAPSTPYVVVTGEAVPENAPELAAKTLDEDLAALLSLGLQLSDVDKHLRKRSLVQRRVLQSLQDRPLVLGGCDSGSVPDRAAAVPAAPPQSFRMTSPSGARPPSMTAVAEEDACGAAAQALAQQLSAQRTQHMHLAAEREAFMNTTHTERPITAQQ